MAKSQYKANNHSYNNNKNNRNHRNHSNPYNNNRNNNNNNPQNRNNFRKKHNSNNFQKDTNRPQHHQQGQQQRQNGQNHKIQKKQPLKEISINTNIKGPLFNKSKLISIWKTSRKIGPGFVNGQNTCFLNSVLECLTYTPPLAQYLLQEEHKKSCRMDGYCALCSMEFHIQRTLKERKSFEKGATILPRYFTSNLKQLGKTLRLGRQEDAHEFYLFLLSAFQKSSIAGLGKLPPKIEETALIYQIFGGKLRSQLKCFGCKATSNNFEACLDLSVDLNNNADTLEKTLENYIKVDKIDGYKCDSCKQIVKAGKQMTVNELPMMLTVHLKRFAFDLQRGYMRKIGTHVKYPEILDMKPYSSSKSVDTKYSLYAVLVHFGYGCDSGHYFAYVKAPNGLWYRMDDEDVQQVNLKEVMSQNAYMLFYQQEQSQKPTTAAKPMEIVLEAPPAVLPAPAIKKKVEVVEEPKKSEKKEEEAVNIPTIKNGMITEPTAAPKKTPKQEEAPVKKEKKRVVLEPMIIADHPANWVMQSSDKPLRSLRGNLSPDTYSSAVSDLTAWQTLSIKDYIQKQKLKKRRVFRKNLESRKAPWKVL